MEEITYVYPEGPWKTIDTFNLSSDPSTSLQTCRVRLSLDRGGEVDDAGAVSNTKLLHSGNDRLQCLEIKPTLADPVVAGVLLLSHDAPFLAYLSACGTDYVRDKKFVDENIHLIDACQSAGFQHVVRTLWHVTDESCMEMARSIYQEMRTSGRTHRALRRAVHDAARTLRGLWLSGVWMRDAPDGTAIFSDGPHHYSTADSRLGGEQVVAADDDDDDDTAFKLGFSYWVPYVHFGI